MLGKLIKYEMKATARIFWMIYALVLIFALLTRISAIGDLASINEGGWLRVLIFTIFISLYVLMLIAMYAATTIIVVTRFYSNMFTSEGYLMFTLPAKPWQLLLSKVLTTAVWVVANLVVTMVSVLIMLSHREIWDAFLTGWREVMPAIQESGVNVAPFVLEFAILMLIGTVTYALPMYACICVGQLWGKHRVLGAFLAYVGLNVISQVIGGVVSAILQVSTQHASYALQTPSEVMTFLHGTFIVSIVMSLVFGAVYFLVCSHIMDKKLNLE